MKKCPNCNSSIALLFSISIFIIGLMIVIVILSLSAYSDIRNAEMITLDDSMKSTGNQGIIFRLSVCGALLIGVIWAIKWLGVFHPSDYNI